MSEPNALAQKLAMLTSGDTLDQSGARLVSVDGDPVPITAILREVDDTVLERFLAFSCGDTTIEVVAAATVVCAESSA
ncbi:hypothetical protein QTO30_11470 [Yoonia sp. GPGPB17]|uniref:hypothetical protein n=1 Tax=Yoonia sp. GPGPB17 TaxID=3026147 RepID=UPI0030BDC5DE